MRRIAALSLGLGIVLPALLCLAACGDDKDSPPTPPPWAKVAPEQIAEAKKHGVPVAFENELGMRFVLIPAGTFLMGAPRVESEHHAYEERLHHVQLTRPFFIQITELTNTQYRRLNDGHDSGSYEGKSSNRGDQPVQDVSWDDAAEFALWLSGQDEQREYRLPSEAQWEYSCRAGTTTPFSFGETLSPLQANFSHSAPGPGLGRFDGPGPERPRPTATTTAGSFPPNRWGLHDMHGNVSEWCQDWYADKLFSDPVAPSVDPLGPTEGLSRWSSAFSPSRVNRGGSWPVSAYLLRSASREGAPHDMPGGRIGFRLISPLPVTGE